MNIKFLLSKIKNTSGKSRMLNKLYIQSPNRLRIAIASPGCLKRSRPTPSQRRKTSFFNKWFLTFCEIIEHFVTHVDTCAKSVNSWYAPYSLQIYFWRNINEDEEGYMYKLNIILILTSEEWILFMHSFSILLHK